MANKLSSKKLKDLVSKDLKDPVIQKFYNRLVASFKDNLAKSNILGFQKIAKDPNGILHYFYNYKVFNKLFGENIKLLNRYVRSAFAEVIARDIDRSMFGPDSTSIYPGNWSYPNLYAMAMTSFFTCFTEDGEPFFNANINLGLADSQVIDQTSLETYEDKSYLRFKGYSPMSLCNFCYTVRNIVLYRIGNQIIESIPNMKYITGADTIPSKLGKIFSELIANKIKTEDVDPTLPMNEQAETFCKLIGNYIITFSTVFLNESGISEEAITDLIAASKNNVYFSDANKSGKHVTQFIHPWVKAQYTIITERPGDNETPCMASFDFRPQDIITLAEPYDGDGGDVNVLMNRDKIINRIGKSLEQFVNQLVNNAIILQIDKSNVPDNVEDTTASESE